MWVRHVTCQGASPASHVSYPSHPQHQLLFPFLWQNARQNQQKGKRAHLARGLRGCSPSWQGRHGRAYGHSSVHAAGTPHIWKGQESVTGDASLPLSLSIQSWMCGMVPPTFWVSLGSSVKPFCKQHHRHAQRCVSPVIPNIIKLSDIEHHSYPLNCPVKLVLLFCRLGSGGSDPGSALSYGCSKSHHLTFCSWAVGLPIVQSGRIWIMDRVFSEDDWRQMEKSTCGGL